MQDLLIPRLVQDPIQTSSSKFPENSILKSSAYKYVS